MTRTTAVSPDGTLLSYQRIGSGPPVVVLPGAMNGGDSWRAVAERLADTFTFLLLDRRFYAPSGPGPAPGSFAREVADGASLTPAVGRYRERLGAGDHFGAIMLFLDDVVAMPPSAMAELVAGSAEPPDPAEIAGLADALLHDLESLAGMVADAGRWASVRPPVLLMAGADSWDELAASTDALRAALPHAEIVTWPGQSHFANMLAPDVVAGSIRDFLVQSPAGSRTHP